MLINNKHDSRRLGNSRIVIESTETLIVRLSSLDVQTRVSKSIVLSTKENCSTSEIEELLSEVKLNLDCVFELTATFSQNATKSNFRTV